MKSKEFRLEFLVPMASLLHLVLKCGLVAQIVKQRITQEVRIAEETTVDGALQQPKG